MEKGAIVLFCTRVHEMPRNCCRRTASVYVLSTAFGNRCDPDRRGRRMNSCGGLSSFHRLVSPPPCLFRASRLLAVDWMHSKVGSQEGITIPHARRGEASALICGRLPSGPVPTTSRRVPPCWKGFVGICSAGASRGDAEPNTVGQRQGVLLKIGFVWVMVDLTL